MIRIIIIFIIIFFGYIYSTNFIKGNYNSKRKRYIVFITIILILQSGLRNWAVGSDTYQYYYRFSNIIYQSWSQVINSFVQYEGKDPFYNIFQKAFQFFSTDYQVYLIFVAFIIFTSLGIFIYKNTQRISHAVVAFVVYMGYYYGFFSITGIRQGIATAFLLYSYQYIKSKRFIPFLLLVLLASLFHITALVFLPLFFIAQIKRLRLLLIIALIGFPFFMIFRTQFASFFISFFGAEDRFSTYATQFERGGSVVLTAFHILLAIIGFIIAKKITMTKPNIILMYNTFALALFFLPLQWVHPSAGRISQYFALVMLVWIPHILDALSNYSKKNRYALYSFSILLFVLITLYSIYSSSSSVYKFFWQYMPIPY